VKLGGSVLTDKTRYRTPRLDALARLAQELARHEGPLVVVHGAGSYGHVLAKEHRLVEGRDGDPRREAAFTQVHGDVRELSLLVVEALRDAGLPAVALATFDLARLDQGRLLSFASGTVADTLAAGLTPVLSGDGALDASRGWGILSGDVVMAELARVLRPERAIFVTDVDGIHDRDPREDGAKLLARVAPGDAVGAGASGGIDITGGMAGKLSRAREVAKSGCDVLVINGHAPGRLADALAGKPVVGTVVVP